MLRRLPYWRKRSVPTPWTPWRGKRSSFSTRPHPNKPQELSVAELAERLIELSETGDGGSAKTGRRFWYLALSHGYVNPDMGASTSAKAEREAAYERITKILGTLRKQGRLGWELEVALERQKKATREASYTMPPKDLEKLFDVAYEAANHKPNWPDGWPVSRKKWRRRCPSPIGRCVL